MSRKSWFGKVTICIGIVRWYIYWWTHHKKNFWIERIRLCDIKICVAWLFSHQVSWKNIWAFTNFQIEYITMHSLYQRAVKYLLNKIKMTSTDEAFGIWFNHIQHLWKQDVYWDTILDSPKTIAIFCLVVLFIPKRITSLPCFQIKFQRNKFDCLKVGTKNQQ